MTDVEPRVPYDFDPEDGVEWVCRRCGKGFRAFSALYFHGDHCAGEILGDDDD